MLCEFCKTNTCALKKNGKFRNYCSTPCQSAHTIAKRQITNLERYGVTNPMKSSKVLLTRDTNNLIKYGVTNPFSLKETQHKQQATCMAKYGVKFASQAHEIQEKIKQAWTNYDGNHPLSDPAVRAKRTETLIEKYGVEHPILNAEIKEKIKLTCLELYGYENAAKSAEISAKIANANKSSIALDKKAKTNLDRYGVEHYTQSEILPQLAQLANCDWLRDKIGQLGQTGIAIALGVSIDTVRKYVKLHNITLPSAGSDFEKQVLDKIKQLYYGPIQLNVRSLIGKEIDIYLPDLALAFECNGTYWHSELNGRTRSYHLDKTTMCNDIGIHLVHVWEHHWNTKNNIIVSRIKSLLGSNIKFAARKCTVALVDGATAAAFLNENHIQGSCSASIRIGLNDPTGKLISLMTFGKSRFNKTYQFELLRFCNKVDTNIVGGASKLFAAFIKQHRVDSVISYSDKSFNKGFVYKQLGFTYLNSSAPAYHYTKDYKMIENRVKFQKHKLKQHFANRYDSDLSEWDNMQVNGYDRIWDCGNDVWGYSTQVVEPV